MIEYLSVTRAFGKKVAVHDLTLTIPGGELFALLGSNGAGKTTSIKMLVGLLRPDSGSIAVCGQQLNDDVRAAMKFVGYVPDEPYMYDKLSGREFLEFVGQMHGLSGATLRDRIRRETEHFQLKDFLDHLVETYSHGMKQRVIFASALLHDPSVLILDEPMVGLDPRSIRLVKDLSRQLASAGRTVFMSTHTLAVAEEIADRIGILDHGKLRFLGTVAELRQEMSSNSASLESLFLELTDEDHNADNASVAGK